MSEEFKIYRMNDCDWWFAASREQAIVDYLRSMGCRVSDHPTPEELRAFEDAELDDEVRELTEEELDRYQFVEGDDHQHSPRRSFRAELERRRVGTPHSEMFASTEY